MSDDKREMELICQVFVDSVNNYFEELTQERSETGLPYIKGEENLVLADYTGMIGISGNRKGFVYITGPKGIFSDLVEVILRRDNPSSEQIMDMAGEVANTVSGNVRKAFGSEFMISVPAIIEGKPTNFKLPGDVPVYVIPIKWRGHEAHIVVGIK
jgi:chemotaxis protein CheX